MGNAASSRQQVAPVMPGPVMLGLGSNRCHGRYGRPEGVLRAAIRALAQRGFQIDRVSPIIQTAPLGPSIRVFANAAVRGQWPGTPEQLLRLVKSLEREFGRKRGQRWGARVLDCDILAIGQENLRIRNLQIPHPRLHERDFVLKPMLAIWPEWRHPVRNLTVRQMFYRISCAQPVDRGATTP